MAPRRVLPPLPNRFSRPVAVMGTYTSRPVLSHVTGREAISPVKHARSVDTRAAPLSAQVLPSPSAHVVAVSACVSTVRLATLLPPMELRSAKPWILPVKRREELKPDEPRLALPTSSAAAPLKMEVVPAEVLAVPRMVYGPAREAAV